MSTMTLKQVADAVRAQIQVGPPDEYTLLEWADAIDAELQRRASARGEVRPVAEVADINGAAMCAVIDIKLPNVLVVGDKLYLRPTERAGVPDGWKLVPENFQIGTAAWAALQFAFSGPGTGENEPFMDCTAWVGECEQDDGSKVYGLHLSCNECPEEGSITMAEFAAAPSKGEQA